MRTPDFWQKSNFLSVLLYPFSMIYYALYKLRCILNAKPYRSKIPVICVGNITAGGSGKTPVVIEIANILKKNNKNFCFLSKGYGGNFEDVKEVDSDNSIIFGDEPVILKEFGDVFVSKDRVIGLKYINNLIDKNYDYIIVDDGLQNPTFFKNRSILVIDGEYGFGNGNILPAGPLREKFNNIISRIDFVIIIGEDKYNIENLCQKNIVHFIKANISTVNNKFQGEYVAFCGIGHPEKFRKTLIDNNIKFSNFIVFGDHHYYNEKDIKMLKNIGKKFITTKKDWVKLDSDFKAYVDYVDIKINLDQNFVKMLRLYGR